MAEIKQKIAVIGAGYWGRNLVRVFSHLGALAVVCDTDADKLAVIKKDYPAVKAVLSYKEVIEDKDLKALVIATPAESHYRLAKEALLAGKDVFVEKPLATIFEQGKELVELAAKNKRILMVGHLLEYHPAVNKLKELINSGNLGKIQYIYSNRLNLGRIRREENILWSFAPHDISVILFLLNEIPQTVSVYGGNFLHRDIADVTVSNLSFSSGIKGHIFVSWLHPYKEHKLVIVGDKGMVLFDDIAKNDKLLLFKHKIDWVDSVPIPKKETAECIKIKMEEPLLLECQHFLDCIKKRKEGKTSGESALKVLQVLQACQVSLEKVGIPIFLDSVSCHKNLSNCYYAHPTSTIDAPHVAGSGTKVWHYSHIMKGARIGKNCVIGQNVFIGSKAIIGNGVKIQNNVSIYDGVKLEDDVFCGPSVVFTNVTNPRSYISRTSEFKETLIKKGATIGANSTILCGITIGEYAFIGAGAVVTKDVPPYALIYGNPALLKGWMCKCGLKLNHGYSKDKQHFVCNSCGKRYFTCKSGLKIA